ncbi:MAG: glycosyltransferase, partial [Bacteroidaceae bacterium]|nr:glycosyltransferase [Bacteroidaceae bacterium]
MRISIVVPVYNVEQYIEDCLSSVTAQTYTGEIECIIVNDCT